MASKEIGIKRGAETEKLFSAVMNRLGHTLKSSTEYENRIGKLDFHVKFRGVNKFRRIDVKGLKNVSLGVDNFNWCLVEFVGTHGFDGWLLGSADYFAFFRRSHFLVVVRKELLSLCNELINRKRSVNFMGSAKYCVYTRKKWLHDDEIGLLEYKHLLDLSCRRFVVKDCDLVGLERDLIYYLDDNGRDILD